MVGAVEEVVEDNEADEEEDEADEDEASPAAAAAVEVAELIAHFVSVTIEGTATPGGSKKYSLLTPPLPSSLDPALFPAGRSFAGSTVVLPSQLTCHSPGSCLVVSSSSHSTMSIFVPSLLLPGSNSKRASALPLDMLGDSTSSF